MLELVKARLGITSPVRDSYLSAIIEGTLQEITGIHGIWIDTNNSAHRMFVVDYCCWRYQSRNSDAGMPRHLQFRLHNLYVRGGAL